MKEYLMLKEYVINEEDKNKPSRHHLRKDYKTIAM